MITIVSRYYVDRSTQNNVYCKLSRSVMVWFLCIPIWYVRYRIKEVDMSGR